MSCAASCAPSGRHKLDSISSPADADALAEPCRPKNVVMIEVGFVGDFSGLLVQRCSRHVSLRAAAAAFAASGEDVGVSDMRDAVIEMANMTAGNLKAILPGECEVSRPRADDT